MEQLGLTKPTQLTLRIKSLSVPMQAFVIETVEIVNVSVDLQGVHVNEVSAAP